MLRSHSAALAGLAVLLVSSTSAFAQMRGAQCMPAVSNPDMYQNCRIQIVRGDEVCRCAIAPRSIRGTLRQDENDRANVGSISGVGVVGGVTSRAPDRNGTTPGGTLSGASTAGRGIPGAAGGGVLSSGAAAALPAGPVTSPAPVTASRPVSGSAQPVTGVTTGSARPGHGFGDLNHTHDGPPGVKATGRGKGTASGGRSKDNRGIGNGFEADDATQAGLAAGASTPGRGDPDNPGRGSSNGVSAGSGGGGSSTASGGSTGSNAGNSGNAGGGSGSSNSGNAGGSGPGNSGNAAGGSSPGNSGNAGGGGSSPGSSGDAGGGSPGNSGNAGGSSNGNGGSNGNAGGNGNGNANGHN